MARTPLEYYADPEDQEQENPDAPTPATQVISPEDYVPPAPDVPINKQTQMPGNPPEDDTDKQLNRLMLEQAGGSSGGAGGMVDRTPAWYQPLMTQQPARKNPLPGLAGNALQGLLSAPKGRHQLQTNMDPLLAEKLRSGVADHNDARKAQIGGAIGGAVSGGLDYLANKKYYDEQSDLSTATKQAQMMQALNGRNGSRGNALEVARYRAKQKADQEKAALLSESQDPNSERSRKARAMVVDSGEMTPQEVAPYSAFDIENKTWRTALRAQANDDRDNMEYRDRSVIREGQGLGREERAVGRDLAKETREQEAKNTQAQLPGYHLKTGVAPPPQVVQKAQDSMQQVERLRTGARELNEIQQKLEADKNSILPGPLGQKIRWVESPEAQALLARARVLHQDMQAAFRSDAVWRMGVPQEYELKIQGAVNPNAGSLEGFFSGKPAWEAIDQIYGRKLDHDLSVWGYDKGDGAAPRPPTADVQAPTYARPAAAPYQARKREAIVAPEQPGELGNTGQGRNVPPNPATQPNPATEGFPESAMYEITGTNGKKFKRRLSAEQARQAAETGYPLSRVGQ